MMTLNEFNKNNTPDRQQPQRPILQSSPPSSSSSSFADYTTTTSQSQQFPQSSTNFMRMASGSGTSKPMASASIWNYSNAAHRRHSSIDPSIWSSSASSNTGGLPSSSNIWSTSTTSPQQQQPQQGTENYTAGLTTSNRSSSIAGYSPPPPGMNTSSAGTTATFEENEYPNVSPTQLFDPVRRHSFTDGYTTGSGVTTNESTLQLVDDYFETDPHERVKVTLQLLNERFFDEEKYLGDAYQLPKFPIESSLRNYQLILVGFKAGRIDVFYLPTSPTPLELMNLKVGDLVIVEADRGRDLGKVFKMNISIDEARLLKLLQFQEQQAALNEHENILDDLSVKNMSEQTGGNNNVAPPTLHFPKSIISLAQPNEIIQILNKKQDEEKACRLCLAKIANATSNQLLNSATPSTTTQDLLQMKLIDAEYQFDRKKLIFYYSTSKRIDFRDLVRELFRIYKTRIWMCAVIGLPYNISRKSVSPLSGNAFTNPFTQPQQQQQQQQQQPIQTQQPQLMNAGPPPIQQQQQQPPFRFERRLSYQPPPTFQQQSYMPPPQQMQQMQQQQQVPVSFRQENMAPRRFSIDSRQSMPQYSFGGGQAPQQQLQQPLQTIPQQQLFAPDFQLPSRLRSQDHTTRNGNEKDEDDVGLNNNSGEAFVLKSLVDSINH
ncbi:uncharacterized protein J8A68_005854 [[Candida] subhashii]|uniref:PSP1 C-terminal domain-containing protein n=1 Tax=[Candida] subhashii TaxID=561895 RepID=A0A8J5UDT4_9ASCO|nr:uncharacterized protein J8A68_005854 [[Candida] subhashii]KAG7660588.1 hypothetical protein J8A68_005854 [[Candida] subhashii]